jgi:phosphatidylglycerophosphate synthase
MNRTGAEKRVGSLLRSALVAQILGLLGVALLAWLAKGSLGLGDWYVMKAVVIYGLVMLIATSRLSGFHPFPKYGPANQVTTMRMVFVALVTGMVAAPSSPAVASWASATSVFAVLLDGVDGWLARRSRMKSAFGARFDVEVDAILIQTLAILAWQYGKVGPWVLLSGLMRYGFVAAGWLWPWMARPLPPSLRAKTICVVQIVALIAAILPPVAPPTSAAIAAAALVALGYSFLVDTLWLSRQTRLETA